MRVSSQFTFSVVFSLVCAFTIVCGVPAIACTQDGAQQQDPPTRENDRATDQQRDRWAAFQERRRRGQQLQQQRPEIPANVQYVPDVVYATATTDAGEPIDLMMDVAFLKEAGAEPMPVIVYIHGGGYRMGSRQQDRGSTIAAARGGYLGVTISYRLAGQAKYPAAVHDCKAAVRFLRANAGELGIDPDRIGVWGHSAGGHLSALLATSGNDGALEGDTGDDDVSSSVACAIDVSGPTDFIRMAETSQRSTVENWFGKSAADAERAYRSASPMTYLDSDDPPLLIIHGTADAVVPFGQAELLRDAATEKGVVVEFIAVNGAGHGIDDQGSMQRILSYFDEHLGGSLAETSAPTRRRDQRPNRADRIRD